jgi:hypothetical protein
MAIRPILKTVLHLKHSDFFIIFRDRRLGRNDLSFALLFMFKCFLFVTYLVSIFFDLLLML